MHTALLGTIGDIEESRHFTVVDDLSLHAVVEGLYDFNKLLWAANLPEHLPEPQSVYRIKSLGEINEDHVQVSILFSAFFLYLPCCEVCSASPSSKTTLALGDDVAYADVVTEAIEWHTRARIFPAVESREMPLWLSQQERSPLRL